MRIDERFKEGVELFNREEFFECHEVLEDLWLETKGRYRDFYKGLIQAAVALYHLRRGNLNGAKALHKTSISYLAQYKPRALGLDVKKLIQDMNSCFSALSERSGKRRNLTWESLIPKINC